MIGQTVSHYRITKQLGAGGMGIVYEAVDTKLDRTVALKFLPPETNRDPDAKARFIHEAKAAAGLTHPNIATVYEIGETDDQLFIAMEFVEGVSLKEKIAAGPLVLQEVLDLGGQIAAGLQEAHDQGIVHRDIKPANIMVTPRGEARILDFGLAWSQATTRLTKTGTTLGTVAYMSPEQANNDPVDQRADIWALGVVLYEMISGRPPFQADYEQAILFAIMNEEAEPITGLRSGVPLEFERLVNKSLSKDPQERYQSARELAVDLRGTSKSGSRDYESPPMRPGIVRRNLAAVAGLLVVAAAVVGVYLSRDKTTELQNDPNDRIMLAVLPFENLGDPGDAYFADGITDEILTKLSCVAELGVIARESSFQYRGAEHSIAEIGQRLGVDYVLQGTIRWQRISETRSRVRITPKLVSVQNNTSIWAEAYEEDLERIFDLQAKIGEKIMAALDITLMGSRRESLRKKPTDNLEAYNNYLRARELTYTAETGNSWHRAVELLEKTVRLDPEFVLGHAWVSIIHCRIYHWSFDRTETRLKMAKASLDAATALDPDLPEVNFAAGVYAYHSTRDYETALTHLRAARSQRPNDGFILNYIGVIKKRQGLFDEAVVLYRQAQVLDPMDPGIMVEEGICYFYRRRFEEAEKSLRYVIDMWPDYSVAYGYLAYTYFSWDGNSERARSLLGGAEGIDPDNVKVTRAWFWIWKLEGKYEEALDLLRSPAGELHTLESDLKKAELFHYLGRTAHQFAVADSVRIRLEEKVGQNPGDHEWRLQLGKAYALSGRMEEAIREGRAAVDLRPVGKDALAGADNLQVLAFIYVLAGEHEQAVELLEYLLSIPCTLTKQLLRNDPAFAPLKDHPRFQQLVQ